MSTEDAIVSATELIYENFDNAKHTLGVCVDFSKAFDTVNHVVLLSKMEKYGIRGLPLAWFKSYLCNRGQKVRINGVCSEWSVVSTGVPQGSVLGLILFTINVNDMTNVSPLFRTVQFADDTTLLASNHDFSTLVSEITASLTSLSHWCSSNCLLINTNKTAVLIFSNRFRDIDFSNKICLENSELDYVNRVKFLGLTLDDKLKFSVHLSNICNKLSSVIGILYRVKDVLPTKILIGLYYSLFCPHLVYVNTIWGGTYHVHLHNLEILQKKIVRIITGSDFLAHTKPLFYQTGILNIFDLHQYLLLIYMFKNRHNFETSNSAYNTRHGFF